VLTERLAPARGNGNVSSHYRWERKLAAWLVAGVPAWK
jgi:hypothetical protein